MMLPRPNDAIHKTHLYRILMGILDDPLLSRSLYFKGGTSAALAGWLDRFSLDLDFDLAREAQAGEMQSRLLVLFGGLGLNVSTHKGLFFVLRYPSRPGERNSIKVSIMTDVIAANRYAPLYLSDIDRYALCQTRDTMVANKLVAPVDRYEKYQTIAGRDIYDIHYFLSHGFAFRKEVIRERREMDVKRYLSELISFVDRRMNDRVIAEDLNYLLPPARFQAIRKTLREETLVLLRDARERA